MRSGRCYELQHTNILVIWVPNTGCSRQHTQCI